MLKKSLISLLFSLQLLFAYAQKENDILFYLNDEGVSLEEFKFIYEKNNNKEDKRYTEDDIREYLDLYIKFKMKVKQAYDQGIDSSASFAKDFNKYRKELSEGYFIDKSVIDRLTKEAYDRMLWEVEVSHVLVFSKPGDLPKDTLKAYKKIKEARQKLIDSSDFEQIVMNYSEDPSIQENKGNLGFFSVFMMIYDFENKAYKTNVGQTSQIFKTKFGYHILKVLNKRKNRGKIETAIIVIKPNPKYPQIAKNKIESIYKELKNGANFEILVEKHSDHKASKEQKGHIQTFSSLTNYLPANLRDAAFKLKKNNDFSEPILTKFGWIIIKRIKHYPVERYEDIKDQIRTKVERDSRAVLANDKRIEQIKKENKYKEYPKNIKIFYKIADSTLLSGKWKINKQQKLNKVVFRIGKNKYTQLDFAEYIEENQNNKAYKAVEYAINEYFKSFSKQTLFKYEDENLEEKYPDFKNLISEYKEGILLFTISEQKVWGKASTDTLALKKYYEKHKEKYKYEKRIDADILSCKNENVLKEAEKMLKEGIKIEKLYTNINKKDALNIKHINNEFEKGDNKLIDDLLNKKKGIYINGLNLIRINKIIKPTNRNLDDVRGLVIADFQKELEKEWVEELEKKYKVKVNEKLLKSIIKK